MRFRSATASIVPVIVSIVISAFGICLSTAPTLAQPVRTDGMHFESATPRPESTERRRGCFRGHPAPTCTWFWITEANVGYDFDRKPTDDWHNFVGGIEVGLMKNIGGPNAVGVVAGASNLYGTLGPRYRRWLSAKSALDLGFAAAWIPGRIEVLELHVAMMYQEKVGIWIKPSYDFGIGSSGLTAGLKAGSQPGLIMYALGAISTGIYIVMLANSST